MILRSTWALCALIALGAPPAGAHHSFAAEFSYEKSGTISGKVIEALFVNPHAHYVIALKDDGGKEVLWDAQTRSPNALADVGWNKDTIRVGEEITIEGNLGRDDKRKIWIREVRKSTGEVIKPAAEERAK
jgi:hypothetical protein